MHFDLFLCLETGRMVRGMTELQAEQIRKMRTQGVGYRAIASVVGLSRDIVRNYCRMVWMDMLLRLQKTFRNR